MIGWIGMPDNDYIDYYQDWNQTLSIPRVIEFRMVNSFKFQFIKF